MKGNLYDAKFLEPIDFAFKKCRFNFVPKAEQLQAIHAVVTGNDVFVKVATGFGKSVCYVVVPYVCDFLRSESHVSSKSVLLIVSPLKALMEDQMDDIRKCGISCLKLHGELPKEQLHDVGALKYQILICSPESLYEESVREQLLKLQKNIVCMAVDEAHCVTVVSMKLLVVDVNRSAMTNQSPARTLVYSDHYFSRFIVVNMIIALIQ